jgi:hypothetical protein
MQVVIGRQIANMDESPEIPSKWNYFFLQKGTHGDILK